MSEKKERFDFPRYEYECLHPAYIPACTALSAEQGNGVSKLLVKAGDTVFEGQTIASGYKTAAAVHAPIPGVVSEITERTMPNGKKAECVLIDFRGSFNFEGKIALSSSVPWNKQSAHKLISQIRHHGIINTFDTANTSLAWQIEQCAASAPALGVRLFDFDPGCFTDDFISSTFIDEVLQGAAICAHALNAHSIVFFYGVSGFDVPPKEKLDTYFTTLSYRFVKLDTRFYPSGSERVLQKAAKKTGEKHSPPIALFIDSHTAFGVYRCMSLSMPLTDTIVEVNGQALHESRMFKVKLGTSIRRLLEECGGCEKLPAKIVINGLIKGTAVCDLDIPVTKYVKTVTVLSSGDIPDQTVSQCVHCGFCRSSCPLGIHPDRIYSHYLNKTPLSSDILLSAHLCDNCALCNAACPARLPLYQTVSKYKEKNNAANV